MKIYRHFAFVRGKISGRDKKLTVILTYFKRRKLSHVTQVTKTSEICHKEGRNTGTYYIPSVFTEACVSRGRHRNTVILKPYSYIYRNSSPPVGTSLFLISIAFIFSLLSISRSSRQVIASFTRLGSKKPILKKLTAS